jgi:RNA polymerase sigma-B factor
MDAPTTRAPTVRRAADPATTASRETTTTHAARPTTGGRSTDDADDEGADGVDPRFAEYRRSGDRALRNTLIEDHRWLAIYCARRFDHKGEPLDDLVQVALVGVLKAVERYDPTFGTRFSTFAVPTVTGELRRHFRDRTWSVHVPRRAKELYQTVSSLVEDLHQSLGRSPSVPEIAERAGVTVEEALQALEVSACYRGVPLSPPGDDEPPDGPTLGEDDGGYQAAEARVTVGRLLAALPTDRERQIIRLRFVDGLTQTQIADEVGVSQVQVSRLLRASLDRMRGELLADSQP